MAGLRVHNPPMTEESSASPSSATALEGTLTSATQPSGGKKTLVLADGSSYLYRAFHAMPDLRAVPGDRKAPPPVPSAA